MPYPHGGKYSNDPYFLTDEEERKLEREQMQCMKPGEHTCDWPHCPCAKVTAPGESGD